MLTESSQFSHDKPEFHYGVDRLTPGVAMDIVRGNLKATITQETLKKVEKSFKYAIKLSTSSEPVYGINTGFGPLCKTKISPSHTTQLQYNLLRSHSCGVGEIVPPEIVKLMMITKLHSLCLGYSGVSPETVKRLQWHIDHNIMPVVYTQGSVGASGDLVPLAHMALPLIGEGELWLNGNKRRSLDVLKEYALSPVKLHPKEGLALINGTQFIVAFATYGINKFHKYLEHADIISSITIDAVKGSIKPFDEALHRLRPHPGSIFVAKKIQKLLHGSEILKSHEHCNRVQDPYSIRCIPQVHGAAWNALKHLKEALEIELNSVTDNPVILDEQTAISGGNFHGEPIALPIDYASIAAIEVGNISDRRSYTVLMGDNEEVPALLTENPGVNSGFMIVQYVSAAVSSENKTLGFPSSADSVPTALGQEDHVSMGSISAVKFNRIVNNLSTILSVELVLSSQALDFRRPLHSSPVIESCHRLIRNFIPHVKEDEELSPYIKAANQLIESGELLKTVREKGLIQYESDFDLY